MVFNLEFLSWVFAVGMFAFIMTFTPGPNNIMLATSGINFGIKRSMPHVMGVAIGFPVMLILVAGGVGFLFSIPIIRLFLKLFGVGYVFYLAYLIATTNEMSKKKVSKPISFLEAAGFQWINPKAWAQAIGASSAYLTFDTNKYIQVFAMAMIFLPIGIASSYVWASFGEIIGKRLREGKRLVYFNVAMAIGLIVTVIPSILLH